MNKLIILIAMAFLTSNLLDMIFHIFERLCHKDGFHVDKYIYFRILRWIIIYVFSFTDENERLILWDHPSLNENEISVLSRLILWASFKIHISKIQ